MHRYLGLQFHLIDVSVFYQYNDSPVGQLEIRNGATSSSFFCCCAELFGLSVVFCTSVWIFKGFGFVLFLFSISVMNYIVILMGMTLNL